MSTPNPKRERRGKLETLLQVLSAIEANEPIKPTHLMYKANFSWQILKEWIDTLKRQGLIEMHVAMRGSIEDKTYSLTPEGRKLVEETHLLRECLAKMNGENRA